MQFRAEQSVKSRAQTAACAAAGHLRNVCACVAFDNFRVIIERIGHLFDLFVGRAFLRTENPCHAFRAAQDIFDIAGDINFHIVQSFVAPAQINFQTPNGKIPSEVARRAKERNLPVLAIAGSLNKGARDNYAIGIDAIFSILREPSTLEEAIEIAPELLEKCAENVMRTLLVGKELGRKLPKTLQQQNADDAN